jgi:hypothetical protein
MANETGDIDAETDERVLRRAYERHLDLLLAEELECRPAFARWFISQADLGDVTLPDGDPSTVTVRISHEANDVAPEAIGEDDLRVRAEWPNGHTVTLLVEDKLDAVLQPRQIERLVARAQSVRTSGLVAGALVVAPRSYLDAQTEALADVSKLSIDDIAERLGADAEAADGEIKARLAWRAKNLVTLKDARRTQTPDHEPTIALRKWLIAELAAIEPAARPEPNTMRTANGTWLYFAPNKALIFKIPNGIVDIYPAKIWPEYDLDNPIVPEPADFERAEDSVPNVVLRWSAGTQIDMAALWDGDRPPVLLEALHACGQASRWIEDVLAAVSASQPRSSQPTEWS